MLADFKIRAAALRGMDALGLTAFHVASFILVATLALGCGDNQGFTPDAAAVVPDADPCALLELGEPFIQFNTFGQLTGLRYPIIQGAPKGHLLVLELYDSSTEGLPALTTGTFDLGLAPNNEIATCQHCIFIAEPTQGVNGETLKVLAFQQRGSVLLTTVVDPLESIFAGTFQAQLQQVVVDDANQTTIVPNGQCMRVAATAFDTTPTTDRCATLADCPNEVLQVCEPSNLQCVPPQCDLDNGGCLSDQACVPQLENGFAGACYDQCNPQRANACGPGRVCKQGGPQPTEGLCLHSSQGAIDEPCDVQDASTSCTTPLICSADSHTCTASCNLFSANPGCDAAHRCSLFGRCEPINLGDPARFGAVCDGPGATLTTPCNADAQGFQGYCFRFRDQDPLTCVEACLSNSDCAASQFCALRFSSGLGACLPDPVCGDGVLGEIGEVCDDGNTANGDTCRGDCQVVNVAASCAQARTLPLGGTLTGDTRTALDGFIASCQGGQARTALFRVTPPTPGRLTITVTSTGSHSVSLRTTCANPATERGCEIDSPDNNRPLVTQVTSAASVTVAVAAFNVLEQGPFTVRAEFVPEVCGDGVIAGREVCDDGNTASNDGCNNTCRTIEYNVVCANAIALSTTAANTGDTSDAPFLFDNACSAPRTGRDRVYKFTAPRAGTLQLSLDQGANDLGLAVFTGCGAPATMTELACSSVLGPNEEASVALTAGQRVTVVVDGFNVDDAGPYSLQAQFQ